MKISKEEKQRIKAERQRVHDIIKYNVSRKYFNYWSPEELNSVYNSRIPVSFYIGTLSVDTICNALWNEMSCNPERFGGISPFKFKDKNSLEYFINQEIDIYDNNYYILTTLQSYLSKFWKLALRYDKTFMTTHRFKNTYVNISTKQPSKPNTKPIPNAAYEMLGCLRDGIHQIATQNITDFKKAIYRDQIVDMIKLKYPQFFDVTKSAEQCPVYTNTELEKYLSNKNHLSHAIWNKNYEITDTKMRIDSLNEFENPGDTTKEKALLQKQTKELKRLESALLNIEQKIKQFTK